MDFRYKHFLYEIVDAMRDEVLAYLDYSRSSAEFHLRPKMDDATETFEDIRNEELVHLGEFTTLLIHESAKNPNIFPHIVLGMREACNRYRNSDPVTYAFCSFVDRAYDSTLKKK